MTSKLKCPFCQQNLRKLFNRYTGEPNCDYECGNHNCDLYGIEMPETVWLSLIQAKQDLEIARKALEYYADSRFGKKQDDGTYALEIDKGYGVTVVWTYDPRPAKQALEQIEQKGNK